MLPRNIPLSKRLFDLSVSCFLLVLLSPILLVAGILVRIVHGSPVFFGQKRPGLRGQAFRIFKFRSMSDACAADGSLLPDEARLTRLGKFLRATSLDELPELLNVLRGEMSLVGPRPLLMQYLERYNPEQARCAARHNRMGADKWAECADLGR
jgi:sugar transferase EpsL